MEHFYGSIGASADRQVLIPRGPAARTSQLLLECNEKFSVSSWPVFTPPLGPRTTQFNGVANRGAATLANVANLPHLATNPASRDSADGRFLPLVSFPSVTAKTAATLVYHLFDARHFAFGVCHITTLAHAGYGYMCTLCERTS